MRVVGVCTRFWRDNFQIIPQLLRQLRAPPSGPPDTRCTVSLARSDSGLQLSGTIDNGGYSLVAVAWAQRRATVVQWQPGAGGLKKTAKASSHASWLACNRVARIPQSALSLPNTFKIHSSAYATDGRKVSTCPGDNEDIKRRKGQRWRWRKVAEVKEQVAHTGDTWCSFWETIPGIVGRIVNCQETIHGRKRTVQSDEHNLELFQSDVN